MSWKTRCVEVVVQSATMLACIGAVISGGFTVHSIGELEKNQTLLEDIDQRNEDVRLRLMVSTILAIASGLVIPLGVVMVLISLCQFDLGFCRKCCVALDVVFISLAVCGYGAAGALGALTAKDWSEDIVKFIDDDIIKEIRTEITATSGCSLLACVSLLFLLLVILVQCIRYNKQLSQERSNYKFTDYMSLKLSKN